MDVQKYEGTQRHRDLLTSEPLQNLQALPYWAPEPAPPPPGSAGKSSGSPAPTRSPRRTDRRSAAAAPAPHSAEAEDNDETSSAPQRRPPDKQPSYLLIDFLLLWIWTDSILRLLLVALLADDRQVRHQQPPLPMWKTPDTHLFGAVLTLLLPLCSADLRHFFLEVSSEPLDVGKKEVLNIYISFFFPQSNSGGWSPPTSTRPHPPDSGLSPAAASNGGKPALTSS